MASHFLREFTVSLDQRMPAGSRGPKYDVIVIGGGHNGLTNAAYLGKAGEKKLVAEPRPNLRGAACNGEGFFRVWVFVSSVVSFPLLAPVAGGTEISPDRS